MVSKQFFLYTIHAVAIAEKRLQQLRKEMEFTERQILRASEELQQLEEAASQKRVSVLKLSKLDFFYHAHYTVYKVYMVWQQCDSFLHSSRYRSLQYNTLVNVYIQYQKGETLWHGYWCQMD